jgi:hypothetical protein
MAVSDQFAKTIRKVGKKFTSTDDYLVEDYLDLDSPTGISTSWTNEYVRPYMVKANTALPVGGVIYDSFFGSYYLIASMKEEYLLGSTIYKYGNLYKCNVSATFKQDIGSRDTNLEYVASWDTFETLKGLLVNKKLELAELPGALIVENTWFLYCSAKAYMEPTLRVTIDGTNYIIRSVDTTTRAGCAILELQLDTR